MNGWKIGTSKGKIAHKHKRTKYYISNDTQKRDFEIHDNLEKHLGAFSFDCEKQEILVKNHEITPVNLKKNPMWTEQNNTLYRKFSFENFVQAFGFMTQVAILAEKADHHPKWTNVYNQVEIWLHTHDAGNIVTEKDRNLATEIDKIKIV